jgi:hypothetical protein
MHDAPDHRSPLTEDDCELILHRAFAQSMVGLAISRPGPVDQVLPFGDAGP